MTDNQNFIKESHEINSSSSSNLLNFLKKIIGWDSWHDWHPMSQTLIKIFPLILILFAIPLTVGFLQNQQKISEFAASPTSFIPFSITSFPYTKNITSKGATVGWYLSDYGTGQVQYGTNSNYGSFSTPETSFVTRNHNQILSNLLPNTIYHFRVTSTNKAGYIVISPDYIFTTAANIPPPTPTTKSISNTYTPTAINTPTPTTASTPTSSSQKIVQFGPSGTAAQFLTLTKDMTVDVIEMAAGTYPWNNVQIDADRTTRPLTIRPAAGTIVKFTGNGATSAGIFFFGLNSAAKWITMDGVTSGGFTFDGIALAQAGVFEIRSSDHLTFKNMTFKNLTRDPVWSDKPYKSWAAYISTSGGRGNDHLLLDHWTLLAPKVYRDVSAIQVASSTTQNGSITITNITMTQYDYAFYAEVPTTNLTLDNWNITDSGNHTTPASVRFTAANINSTYKNLHATLSDHLLNNSTGTMVNGGGNSGL